MIKKDLIVVPECDNEETGEHSCWAIPIKGSDRNHYVWISKYDDKEYIVEDSHGNNLANNKVYKTLSGAKKKAEEIAFEQETERIFTD